MTTTLKQRAAFIKDCKNVAKSIWPGFRWASFHGNPYSLEGRLPDPDIRGMCSIFLYWEGEEIRFEYITTRAIRRRKLRRPTRSEFHYTMVQAIHIMRKDSDASARALLDRNRRAREALFSRYKT